GRCVREWGRRVDGGDRIHGACHGYQATRSATRVSGRSSESDNLEGRPARRLPLLFEMGPSAATLGACPIRAVRGFLRGLYFESSSVCSPEVSDPEISKDQGCAAP